MSNAILDLIQIGVSDVQVLCDFIERVLLWTESGFNPLNLDLLLVQDGFESIQVIPLLRIHRSHVSAHHLVIIHLDVIGWLRQHEILIAFLVDFNLEFLQVVLEHAVDNASGRLYQTFRLVLQLVGPDIREDEDVGSEDAGGDGSGHFGGTR